MIPDQRRRKRHRLWAAVSSAALAVVLTLASGAIAPAATAAAGPDGPTSVKPLARHPKKAAPDRQLRQRIATAAEQKAGRTDTGRHPRNRADIPKATPFIIGGTETTISSAPWMVQLWYYDEASGSAYFCGGSLVAADKVLTAAHCVAGLDWVAHGAVLAGTTDLQDDTTGTVAAVARQWQHPRYNPDTVQNDIAVLTLDRPLEQQWLRLAASTDSALYTPGTTGTVYGWGLTDGDGSSGLSSKLRKANLPMVSDATCNTAMASVLGGDYLIEGSMFCAGTPASGSDEGTTSPCNGDSGGPLVVGGKIVGVVSWGVAGCTAKGAYPVFTKVSSYFWAAQPRIDDTDLTGDGRADLLARTPSGNLFQLDSRGTSFAQRAYVGNGWENISWGIQADLDRDGFQDLIVRDRNDGRLYRNYLSHADGSARWMEITTVWGGWKSYAIPGDLTGDARPDLIAVDSSGNAYLYPGRGNGQFSARTKVVSGSWKGAKVFGHGDLSGDGKADVLVRDTSNTLWLYRGTGKASAPFASRIKARTGWNFTALVSTGDMNGDGRTDVLARSSDGTLYLYRGTGKASTELFSARLSLGTGYNQYNLLL